MSVKSKGLTVPDKNAADGANRGIRKYIRHNWQLWIMLFPAMLYILIFCYVPMYGIQLAFREYSFTAGITGGKFVGMKYFRQYFESPMFWTTLKNTFVISATSILVGFPVPIILAMVINQIRSPKWKRTVQTTVYIPYFISVVVLVSMLNIMFANDSGVIANFFKKPAYRFQGYEHIREGILFCPSVCAVRRLADHGMEQYYLYCGPFLCGYTAVRCM